MLSSVTLPLLSLLTLIPAITAQQAEWAQCGGIGWTGGTVCASGTVCTALNSYYSQCLTGTTSATHSITGIVPPPITPTSPTAISSVPIPTPPSGIPGRATNYWFSFGDSYSQTGFLPNLTLPAPGNPLGNPAYPGYTAVGGVNWIDVATVVYNKSLVLTYNYAYGGATIDASLVTPYEPTVLSLTDQVNQFLTGAGTKPAATPWTSGNSLFSIWIGVNDIGNSYYNGEYPGFADTLLNAEFALVQKLVSTHNVGARNFLFLNVPAIDRTPLMLAESTTAQALEKSVISTFNTKYATAINAFKANNTGVQTWLWDANTAFNTVLNSPTTFGFVDAASYGNTGDFWGNNYHPSSAAQTMWGQQVGNLMSNTVW